jgi:hypothetical protein
VQEHLVRDLEARLQRLGAALNGAAPVTRQLRAQGLSLRAVAAELHQRGIRSRTGRGFAPVQVKRMVE